MFLYVISDGQSIKIGISKHPLKRLKQLQTGHPNRLSIAYQIETQSARKIEAHLHHILSHYRSHSAREWFSLSLEPWLIDHIESLALSLQPE